MDIISKAKEAAKKQNKEIVRVFNVGSNDSFYLVTMITPESEKTGDGFDDLLFGVNKQTGKEVLSTYLGLPNEPGFENLRYGELSYKLV